MAWKFVSKGWKRSAHEVSGPRTFSLCNEILSSSPQVLLKILQRMLLKHNISKTYKNQEEEHK